MIEPRKWHITANNRILRQVPDEEIIFDDTLLDVETINNIFQVPTDEFKAL